jgi:K+-transporting ATPase ATPase C chain
MNQTLKILKPALICFILMTVLCGMIYPGVVTGIAQAAFPDQANGSMLTVTSAGGAQKEYGSALIAQKFAKPEYLIGRPPGVTNLSPAGPEQETLVRERTDWWHSLDPGNTADIPADLVTASGSGVDPNISPEAAEYQAPRIARERGVSEEAVRSIIKECTSGRFLGFWGEPAVNVLRVNLMLDGFLESE